MRRPRFDFRLCLCTAALVLFAVPAQAADKTKPLDDAQDFVFLGEARPVLVRLHVRVDGKPLRAAWDDFMKYLFNYLDTNHDGVLSKEEAERAPTPEQILTGGLAVGLGGRRGGDSGQLTMADLDTDKDRKVTMAELAAYYRKNGLAPFQFRVDSGQANPLGGLAYLGGPRPDPPIEEVRRAIFALLDTNKDGKLSKEELAAAPDVLLRLDDDDDEIITAVELVPNARPADPYGGIVAMARPGRSRSGAEDKTLVLIPTPGEVPPTLVRRMQERYGPRSDKPEQKKLSRKDLGLDEATFGRLDANKDGVLDSAELAAFVKRAPDVELVMRVGKKGTSEATVEVVTVSGGPSPLADKVKRTNDVALLDLGVTRVELRGSEEAPPDRLFTGILRQQLLVQFKQADKDNNGYLDEKEARASRVFRSLFKVMDRDGDGKLYEKEVIAYLDQVRAIQTRANASCVSLVLSDQSRGLFDLLDINRDGRLSVREMRQAPKLLAQLDRGGKGYLTKDDIPRTYQLALNRGPANAGDLGAAAAIFSRYLGGSSRSGPDAPTAGPLWFRKMDLNRDGDVSRSEFLGSDELFKKIDTDGDGLISVEEAERYDAQLRKQK